MSDNVVMLPGAIIPDPAEPNGNLVDRLRGLLDEAERGEVVAVAVVKAYANGNSGFWIESPGMVHPLSSGILAMSTTYAHFMVEPDDDE